MEAVRVIGVAFLVVAVCLLAGSAVALVAFPAQTAALVEPFAPGLAQTMQPGSAASHHSGEALAATQDADLPTEKEEEAYRQAHKGRPAVYPLIAQCQGVDLHSPIAPADLTGLLFHQASYPYALVMETRLPDADIESIDDENPPYVNREQLEGDWLDAQAMHIWRSYDTTGMDTSADVGAEAGTAIRAPVTGTVVLVRDYLLYDRVPDVEVHIQPQGRPDLDVVLIHTQDPLVKAGDAVEAGVTPIARVRDIAESLTDVQLGYYTVGDDPGNHTHIQVNDADYPEYRETRLQ